MSAESNSLPIFIIVLQVNLLTNKMSIVLKKIQRKYKEKHGIDLLSCIQENIIIVELLGNY